MIQMSEKVFKEYCEDCGCPLDICCKPQQPVVSLQAIRKKVNLESGKGCSLEKWNMLHDWLAWAEKEAKK